MIHGKLFFYQIPFVNSIDFKGNVLNKRCGYILQLSDTNGHFSWGEIAPLPGFSQETLAQAKSQIIKLLEQGITSSTSKKHLYPSVQFALSCALQKIPLCSKSTSKIPVIPLLQGDILSQLAQYKALGFPSSIKIKVGRASMEQDTRLFNSLTQLNTQVQIRCDANQAWSASQASLFFSHISRQHLYYIEEPTPKHTLNLTLAHTYKIALALDETLQDASFIYQTNPQIKALILKPTLIGSLRNIKKWVHIAQKEDLHISFSSSFESSVALQHIRYLAEQIPLMHPISLGVDTLKYFQKAPLTQALNLKHEIQHLECVWTND
ncbi:o-succinylbenzoate synthase [Psychromonas sp. CD1]|uniref:o-succinylbenzoate synthase n=1 Tax=Psychromonas sp. CD1 TaxID=1979839 RepID=UPI000B9C24DD|nr:o-succinylbenzoate synthase [Psychromonas sp. CD1]